MARQIKKGFDYFALDCAFFDDIKTRKLIRRCGPDAVAVYLAILCLVFRDGYYLVNDDDLPFVLSEKTGVDEDACAACISACVSVGLIDETLFQQGIITSRGIQKRYNSISQQTKRVSKIEEYNLLESSEEIVVSSEDKGVSSEEMGENDRKMAQSSEFGTQRKEKKRKVNKNISSLSSFQSDSEEIISEEEKEKILFDFVFVKNLAAPGKELELFLAYNNRDGRSWASMSEERKCEALMRWKQEPKQEPRFKPEFLEMWRTIFEAMLYLHSPLELRMKMLSDKVTVAIGGRCVVITCDEAVAHCLEQEDMIEKVRPAVKTFLNSVKRGYIQYKFV